MSASENDKMDIEKSSDDDSMSSMDTSSENGLEIVLDKLLENQAENARLKTTVEKQEKTIYQQIATIRGLRQNKLVYASKKDRLSLAKDKKTPSTSGSEFETVLEKLLEIKAENAKMKTLFEEQQATIARQGATILRLYKEKFTAAQDRIVTVYDVTTADGKIDYEQLNQKILVVNTLVYNEDCIWIADGAKISLDDLVVKPWITARLYIQKPIAIDYVLNLIELKDLKALSLLRQSLTLGQYKSLATANIEDLSIWMTTMKNEDGSETDVADILKEVPNINSFVYNLKDDQEVKPEAVQKLVDLPPFKNLEEFHIYAIHANFDLEVFAEFIEKNPKAEYHLDFHGASSEFTEEIKEMEKKIRPALPATCKFLVSTWDD